MAMTMQDLWILNMRILILGVARKYRIVGYGKMSYEELMAKVIERGVGRDCVLGFED